MTTTNDAAGALELLELLELVPWTDEEPDAAAGPLLYCQAPACDLYATRLLVFADRGQKVSCAELEHVASVATSRRLELVEIRRRRRPVMAAPRSSEPYRCTLRTHAPDGTIDHDTATYYATQCEALAELERLGAAWRAEGLDVEPGPLMYAAHDPETGRRTLAAYCYGA